MQSAREPVPVRTAALSPAAVGAIMERLDLVGYAYVTEPAEGFDYSAELAKFGTPIRQYGQEVVCDVRPDPDLAPGTYSALGMGRLNPHTECYEFPGVPPRYVALWCVRAARGLGGETALADAYQFLRGFSESDLTHMRSRVYEWYGLPAAESEPARDPARHPILEDHPRGVIMRYSSGYVQRPEDGLMPRYIDGGRQFFDANHVAIAITAGAILIWDNWRMIHGRNAFTDPGRHLRRMLLV